MAFEVIDLISSSPPRQQLISPIRETGRIRCISPPSGQNASRSLSSKSTSQLSNQYGRIDSVNYISKEADVYDKSGDGSFQEAGEPQSPLKDVSDSNACQTTVYTSHQPGYESRPINMPPLLINGSRPHKRRAVETIEFTSSLEPVSPRRPTVHRNNESVPPCSAMPNRKLPGQIEAVPLSSDPFASSPPALKMQASADRAISLVDFDSSPGRAQSSHKLARTASSNNKDQHMPRNGSTSDSDEDDPDPFEDANESSAFQRPIITHQSEDLIFIDSASSSSDNDGDELPTIKDMAVQARHCTRSPLHFSGNGMARSKSGPSRTAAAATRQVKSKKTAAERNEEKERKRQEREQLNAAKAVEKQRAAAFAEVNKLRTDKKVSTPEMIVDLPSSLSTELQTQVQEMLRGLGVEYFTWDCPHHSMIKWRRKVTCRFHDEMGLWEPISPRIMDENIVVLVMGAEDFVKMAVNETLPSHVDDLKRQYNGTDILYILQGMSQWLRKNRNNRNRQFVSGVRSGNAAISSASRSAPTAEHISEDIVEDALLALQVDHDMFIHHTAVAIETARWIANLTQHISTIPYKRQRDQATSVAGFCMESGQVRTGDSTQDTYVRMLQEISRVTVPISYGIAREFDTVTKLVQGLDEGGPQRLENLRKSTNKDGVVSDRTIGQAMSRRIYKVFTGKDSDSTDV